MLPFLRPDKMVSVIVAKRKPEGQVEDLHKEDEAHPDLIMAAEDLIRAVHSKDTQAVADALEQAFYVCDSEPHVEGPHEEEGE